MKTPTLAPPASSFKTQSSLARDKSAQSNTRWMRGDYNGALQSGLDTVQMGHDLRRGCGLFGNLVGIAMSAIGRRATGDTIEHINATQAKSAARRLEKLLANRWNLDQALAEQKNSDQAAMLATFARKNWRSNFYDKVGGFNEKLERYTVSKQQIIDDIGAEYDRQIANAKLPYIQKGAPPAKLNDPFAAIFQSPSNSEITNEARDLIGDQMLMLSLALHAYKLEHGAYPPNLNALVPNYVNAIPADPFGGGEPLRYKFSGKTYVLWSIGPDGKNDDGKPIPPHGKLNTPLPGERPFGVRQFVDFDGKGDVVAGVNG